jgi:CRISPR system Cascade subunit CasE
VYAHARYQAVDPAALPSREALYLEWLSRAFGRDSAASLEAARLAGYRSIHVLRRPLRGAARSVALIEGPDATLEGSLRVGDPAAFAAMLARGVGRHAAFGFGMLLLAPPGSVAC